jgi:hypothetical protein
MSARARRVGLALGALGCGLLGALLYAPAAASGRLADDWVLLRTVRRVSGIGWPFTHNDLGQAAGAGHFYRPLWVLSNAAVYDLSHSPTFAHVVNLFVFAIVCAEVVLLVGRIAGLGAGVIAGVTVAVFPSHGESVAWISGNTDLLAVALGLAAILVALLAAPSRRRDVGIAVLTALAALTKEIATVLPVLMAILLWAAATGERPRGYWRPALVMLATVLVVLIPRTVVVGGIGGYGGQPLTPVRVGGAFASFILGGLSAPQLLVLAHPVLLLVPAAAVILLALGAYVGWRARAEVTGRLAVAGIAWFLVSLVPVLNQPLNLNTRNGDRLLLLPSVGLAVAAGALVARARHRTVVSAWIVVAALCAVSCVLNALDWRTAGRESRRILAEIHRVAPAGATVVALSFPTDYRAAHLYPDGLEVAIQETGNPHLSLTGCMPAQPLSIRPRQVSFTLLPAGLWFGQATTHTPFEVPVLGSAVPPSSATCLSGKAPGQPAATVGTALTAFVAPSPVSTGAGARVVIYFDGRDMVRVP